MKHLDNKTIWDLVTGDLVESTETFAHKHISSCQKCRQEHEVISLIHQDSFTVPGETPSMRFSKSVMEEIEAESKLNNSVQYWMIFTKYAIIGAFCVAVLSCLVVLGSNNNYILNELDQPGNVLFILIFACIAPWIFFIFDKILLSLFEKKY